MESYDERRRREEERRQGRQEDSGRHRDTWWQRGGHDEDRSQRSEDRSQRAESGGPDYGRDYSYSRSDERQGRREEGRDERSRFSPDWSREGAEPRYSDLPYYSRNRDQDSGDYSRRDRSGGSQSDDRRLWEQRARASVPRSQQNLAEHGEPGDYYDPDWPYDRGRSRDFFEAIAPPRREHSADRITHPLQRNNSNSSWGGPSWHLLSCRLQCGSR